MKRIYGMLSLAVLMLSPGTIPAANFDELSGAVIDAMKVAREALSETGPADAAMKKISTAVARVASQPNLKKSSMPALLPYSTSAYGSVLASDGDEALTLILFRYAAGSKTPVHDETTWGVIRVVEGQNRIAVWQRNETSGAFKKKSEKIFSTGSDTYWLAPPNDIHSRAAGPTDVWEVVMAGKNLISNSVVQKRRYFDPATGRSSHRPIHGR